MAGLTTTTPFPQDITVHAQSRLLEIVFSDGAHFKLPFELMRVYSPSAEVQGHGPGQEVLQTGKREVGIVARAGRQICRATDLYGRAQQRYLQLGLPLLSGDPAGRTVGRLRTPSGSGGVGPRRPDG